MINKVSDSPPVLVTGAAGFIGYHVALRLLQEGRRVVGCDNLNAYYDVNLKLDRLKLLAQFQAFSFVKLDISDRDAMERIWADHGPFLEVVHLAAQAGVRYSLQNPYDYISSNCMGHITVLEMCRHTDGFKHLVYASSSSVYGGNKKLPYAVDDPVNNPVSLYAATKRADELFSYSYSHLYKIPQTGLRFFTVYGPWGRPDMSPYIFAESIANGKPVQLFNNGNMKRDFTYIDDVVDGVLGVLKCAPNQDVPYRVLNMGRTQSENLMDFVREIEAAIGLPAQIHFQDMQPGDVYETCADITETVSLTGFNPQVSIQEGIPRFISWFKSYYAPDERSFRLA